jgi:hypothetical protein
MAFQFSVFLYFEFRQSLFLPIAGKMAVDSFVFFDLNQVMAGWQKRKSADEALSEM